MAEVLTHALQVLDQVNRMASEMSDFAVGVRGHVRIWANTSAIVQFLPTDLQRVGQESLASRREFDAAWMAHQQRAICGPFEVGDAFADRGDRHVAALSRTGQAAGFGDRQKDAQRVQIEVRRIDHEGGQ
jgi:hypothetical protein